MPPRLQPISDTGRSVPVSLIGWSLGGIYARELARQNPQQVRQVITLASPFALTDPRQSHADRVYQRRSELHAAGRVPTPEQVARPIGAPSTAVYSRRDGIVSWQACIEPATALHENVEVRCGHLGFGVDPATLWLIADRLAAAAGRRRGFRPPSALRLLYPARGPAAPPLLPPQPTGWHVTAPHAEEHSLCSSSPVLMPPSWRWRQPPPRATSAGCACWILRRRPRR